jgi:hypothetical protein
MTLAWRVTRAKPPFWRRTNLVLSSAWSNVSDWRADLRVSCTFESISTVNLGRKKEG